MHTITSVSVKKQRIRQCKSNLLGSGAINAKIEGRCCRIPAINSLPKVDIPCLDDPPDPIYTFWPLRHKLR